MIRALCLLPLLCLAPALTLATPAGADELPIFAGGGADLPSLKAQAPADPNAPPAVQPNPWAGLTMGTEMFGASGFGHGSKGGFGGDTFIGYNKEFDNNVVLGVQGSIGRLPGLSDHGPSAYNFGMADVKLGYDMGRIMPYVSFGVGQAGAAGGLRGGLPNSLDSVNNLFTRSRQSVTLTRETAGFDYAVTDNLHISASVSAIQAHGQGFGPPITPQPGAP